MNLFTFFLTETFFNEERNIFVLKTNTKLVRGDDEELRTMKLTLNNPYTVVYEKFSTTTPIWLYIVSSIVGILIMILVSYALYRCGFFKRESKQELQKLRESHRFTAEEMEELSNLR